MAAFGLWQEEADLEDLPDEVRQALQFKFADTVDDVLDAALEPGPCTEDKKKKRATPKPKARAKTGK